MAILVGCQDGSSVAKVFWICLHITIIGGYFKASLKPYILVFGIGSGLFNAHQLDFFFISRQ